MSGNRLPKQPTEWIDRNRPIRFTFEGRPYQGFAGDTISSALHAAGVSMLGRSFKYHRPRGIYSMANHDVNAMFEDQARTNIRGDVTPIYEGATYRPVNVFGSLESDRLKIMDTFSRFFPVGFYYKTFFRPRSMFPFWENQMRKAAGLGNIDRHAKREKTPKRYDWCDVLVIGAGPSGLSAAIAASESGAKVLCIDEHPKAGGSLNYQHGTNPRAAEHLATLLTRTEQLKDKLEIRTSTLAAGYYPDHWIALVDEIRLTKLRARSVIFAQGAFEQPAVFRHNDLPGAMLGSAAQRLIRQYGVKPFDNGVVLTANLDGYRVALDLHSVGVHVAAVLDLRPGGENHPLAQQAAKAGIAIRNGYGIYEAVPRANKAGITGAIICPLDAHGHLQTDKPQQIACDGIAMSVGWAGADGLLYQSGARMKYSVELHQFVPPAAADVPKGIFAAGRVNGVFDLNNRMADGTRAGRAAAASLGLQTQQIDEVPRGPLSTHPYPIFYHPKGKAFIDLDEDVQLKDLVNAEKEGFDNIELLKRYSTFGMGPSQGKIANTNTMRVLANVRKQSVAETGMPTSRPFWHPVEMRVLGGRGFAPHRYTPMQSRHQRLGAVEITAGDWQRPAYYAPARESREQAILAEVQAVRQRVGIIDVGTLGKLEISGPDAGEFIERVYTGKFKNMKPGTTRYGLMVDESGVVIDDGVIGRMAEDRYYVTTTTTASGSVYREMQRYAIVWGLNVTLVNGTGLYGAMNLAGPESRKILAPLCNIGISDAAFPYLGLREAEVLGVPARLMRVGFVGELGYEIHVPALYAGRVWDGLMEAGKPSLIKPFGVEAQRVLRLEKAHVIVSQDTDGLSTPFEANMEWAIKDDKPFFIGQRSLRIVRKKPLTRKLVGFEIANGSSGGELPKECHLVIDGNEITGRVTSIVKSPTLHRVVGLAYVGPHQAKVGTRFSIRIDGGAMVGATVIETPFYDPKSERQKIS